ncbi:hypothetical protein PR202_gb22126 [Eleusine coracana subsp. coracana]|uniref:Glycosyltransferases n=1 Tax=Eleusine coracana subsp. coracana TaxID=191504 RepID=A0AAV5FFS4_ELECO|nr:hypothetical protein PR202_gb22126 [Eleusine coracana subsp. coracana]
MKGRRPDLVLRRAMLHSCICFVLGLFTGLAPWDWTEAAANANKQVFRALHAINNSSHYLPQQQYLMMLHEQYHQQAPPSTPDVVVVVTTTGVSERERRSAGLTSTAHALRLVSPPVVWLVVEAARDAAETALLLRRTGVVYRHVTYNHNFSSLSSSDKAQQQQQQQEEEELHHQRTLALAHIEHHRLRGVVLFSPASPTSTTFVSCTSSDASGLFSSLSDVWCVAHGDCVGGASRRTRARLQQLRRSHRLVLLSSSSSSSSSTAAAAAGPRLPDVDVHGFAFNSDLLLDPARWDRFPTSEPDQSQDSIKFLQRLLVQDYNKTRAINCSQIMAWRVDTALL